MLVFDYQLKLLILAVVRLIPIKSPFCMFADSLMPEIVRELVEEMSQAWDEEFVFAGLQDSVEHFDC
ncbi:unnamed protein product [Blepharisma stoltei]|uniref:Uncharacterized protein n=1 Tax=Blepharisma stoltei TaxID=1481888 RepID=A0AAU9JAF9_9CILI|nr:unnamed protein product [Blepharisma stoltei]